jgi:hypothetical protein
LNTGVIAVSKEKPRGSTNGLTGLSMIQDLQQEGGASTRRDFAVGPSRESAVVIENAGEPLDR